jgi:hypothetical protein
MPLDLPTLVALVGMGGVVAGVIIELYRTRLRIKELEEQGRQSRDFMAAFREMVAASEAGVRIQQSQLAAAQNALWVRQSAEAQAVQIREQNAAHERLMGWLSLGVRAYNTYRKHHPPEDE